MYDFKLIFKNIIKKLDEDMKNLEEYRMKSSNFWIRYLNALRD